MIATDAVALFDRLVDGNRRFVLCTHVNPDGDAIGSQMALASLLLEGGREVRIVNQDPTPFALQFLEHDSARAEAWNAPVHEPVLDAAEVLVLLDNSAPDRLGALEEPLTRRAGRVLCVDHHPTRGTPWAWNVLDESACATAAIVWELGRARGFAWSLGAAEALYTGLATDTGFFRFNSTTARAHRIAAELVGAGVDPARCFREVYERNSVSYTRLLGEALTGLTTSCDGALAAVRITTGMVRRCGAENVDTSEMTTPVLAIDGVRVAALFRELPGRRVKVSLRSKGSFDVHRLATEFGGGGHRNASGIVLPGTLDEIEERVIGRAVALL